MSSIPPPSTPYIHPSRAPLQEVKPMTISKIELSTKDLDKLQSILNSRKLSPSGRDLNQRKIVGICFDCGGVPDYIITYFYEGLTKIEKYCTKCLEQEQDNGKIKVIE